MTIKQIRLVFISGFIIQAISLCIVLVNYNSYPDSVIVHSYAGKNSYGPKDAVFGLHAMNLALSLIILYCFVRPDQKDKRFFYAVVNVVLSILHALLIFDMLEVI